ncbi:histidine phosphatase family protein [Micrococcus sp.]|uniref:histidine phosphatase family protein n=1 Tax=Micrococcus sp. TaxID=1271 RepID=UPI002A917791|nr:histidine phosphatase family protein [Micrococcus sp.]MDY6054610.1 histidine phosphatase family protein [Micrococcus sp.]
MRLILLRHGETDWNAQDRFQGRTDVELNAEGERQARRAAAGPVGDLLEASEQLVAVSSPLLRARRTAEIVLEARVGAAELTLEPDLQELFGGDWEGMALSGIADRWPEDHRVWRQEPRLDHGPVGGESLRTGGERVIAGIRRHVPASWSARPGAESDSGASGSLGAGATAGERTLLAVAHGGVLRAAAGLLLGREGEAFTRTPRLGNARAVVLEGSFDAAPGSRVAGEWELTAYDL